MLSVLKTKYQKSLEKIEKLEAGIKELRASNSQQSPESVSTKEKKETDPQFVDRLEEGEIEIKNQLVTLQEYKKFLEEQVKELETRLEKKIDKLGEIISNFSEMFEENKKLKDKNTKLKEKTSLEKENLIDKLTEEKKELIFKELEKLFQNLEDNNSKKKLSELQKLVGELLKLKAELEKAEGEKIEIEEEIIESKKEITAKEEEKKNQFSSFNEEQQYNKLLKNNKELEKKLEEKEIEIKGLKREIEYSEGDLDTCHRNIQKKVSELKEELEKEKDDYIKNAEDPNFLQKFAEYFNKATKGRQNSFDGHSNKNRLKKKIEIILETQEEMKKKLST